MHRFPFFFFNRTARFIRERGDNYAGLEALLSARTDSVCHQPCPPGRAGYSFRGVLQQERDITNKTTTERA